MDKILFWGRGSCMTWIPRFSWSEAHSLLRLKAERRFVLPWVSRIWLGSRCWHKQKKTKKSANGTMVTTRHIRSSFNLSQIKVQKTSIAVRCQFESCMLDHLLYNHQNASTAQRSSMVKPSNIEVLPDSLNKHAQHMRWRHNGLQSYPKSRGRVHFRIAKGHICWHLFFDPQKDGSNWLKLGKHRKTICKTQRQHTLSDRWRLLGYRNLRWNTLKNNNHLVHWRQQIHFAR